jgi:hypothetical protein
LFDLEDAVKGKDTRKEVVIYLIPLKSLLFVTVLSIGERHEI